MRKKSAIFAGIIHLNIHKKFSHIKIQYSNEIILTCLKLYVSSHRKFVEFFLDISKHNKYKFM